MHPSPVSFADELKSFGSNCGGERAVQCSDSDTGMNRKIEVCRVVGSEPMLAGKPQKGPLVGIAAHADRQSAEITQESVGVGGFDAIAPFIDNENVSNLDVPQSRYDRFIVKQPIHGGVRDSRLLVGKAPARSDRCVKDEGHQGLRPRSRASSSS